MKSYLIILLFISSVCNAQVKSMLNDTLRIYRLIPDTVHDNNYNVETTLYGEITKEMIKKIEVEKGYSDGDFTININLKKKYWLYFQSITEKFVGSQMGIFFNNELISTPMVNSVISKGGLNIYLSSQDKAELIYKNLGGKGKIKAFVEKKTPNYYNEDYYPNEWELLEKNVPIDSIMLLFANAILSTPDDKTIHRRNEILGDVIEWFLKDSELKYLLGKKYDGSKNSVPDNHTLRITYVDSIYFAEEKFPSYSREISLYYMLCLTKAGIENRNLSDTEIKIKATEHLIKYIFNQRNYTEHSILPYQHIKRSKFLKSLKRSKNIKKSIESADI